MRVILAATLMATSVPAAAQFTSRPSAPAPAMPRFGPSSAGIDAPAPDVYRQIRRERRAGDLSRGEARQARRQARVNDAIAAREGNSESARAAATFRANVLDSQVKAAGNR